MKWYPGTKHPDSSGEYVCICSWQKDEVTVVSYSVKWNAWNMRDRNETTENMIEDSSILAWMDLSTEEILKEVRNK